MKWKLTLLLAIVIGALAGSWIKNLPGFVIIAYDKTSYEMRLWVAFSIVLAAVCILLLILAFVRSIFSSAGKVKTWQGTRSWKKSRRKTIEGMLAFSEGRWKKSEDIMVKAAKTSDTQLINYLVAAQAAQHQNAQVRRDTYLRLAHEAEPAAKTAIGLTQAQLQIQQNQFEQALASLNDLKTQNPNHPYVIKLLARLYEKLSDWENLLTLLPQLKKLNVYSLKQYERIESICIQGLLNRHTQSVEVEELKNCWQNFPSSIRKTSSHIYFYCEQLVKFEQWNEAEALLKPLLKKSAQARVVSLIGQIKSSHPEKLLAFVESWQASTIEQPKGTFLALSKLAFNSELWGKSKDYAQKSLIQSETAEAYLMVAKALEALGDIEQSIENYKLGLAWVTKQQLQPSSIALPQGSDDLISADLLPKFQKINAG